MIYDQKTNETNLNLDDKENDSIVNNISTIKEDDKEHEEEKVQIKKIKKKSSKNMFSINTSFCRSELELIQHIISSNDFMVDPINH